MEEGCITVVYHESFRKEINDLMETVLKGKEKKFSRQSKRMIEFIEHLMPYEIIKIDSNEVLKHVIPVTYSFHLCGKGYNIRYLARYKSNICVLLLAFNETQGKNSYSKKIPFLDSRMKESEENEYKK